MSSASSLQDLMVFPSASLHIKAHVYWPMNSMKPTLHKSEELLLNLQLYESFVHEHGVSAVFNLGQQVTLSSNLVT